MKYRHERGKFLFEHIEGNAPGNPRQELAHEDCYELVYFVSGNLTVIINGEKTLLPDHSLVIIKPGQKHRFIIENQRADYYNMRFPAEEPPVHLTGNLDKLSSVYVLPGTRISEEFQRTDVYSREIHPDQIINVMIHQLGIIMNYTCNIVGMRTTPPESPMTNANVIHYIKRHINTIHHVNDIAANVHLSASSIYKIVLEETGMPVMAYIRQQQCILAQKLFDMGNSAGEVCSQLGFQNYSTFYRIWKKYNGTAPGEQCGAAARNERRV